MSGEVALRCLWISAEVPEVPRTGLHRYSMGVRRGLVEAGVDLEVVGLGRPQDQGAGVPRTWLVPGELRGGLRSITSLLPNVAFACKQPLIAAVEYHLARRQWDAVVIDHLQTAWAVQVALQHRNASPPRVVFLTHNHEAVVRREVANSHRAFDPRGAILRLDAHKAGRLERRAVDAADVVTCITEEDASSFRRRAPGARFVVLPPGYEDPRIHAKPAEQRRRQVVVLGSFDWHVKAENLRRFLQVADPIFAGANIELVVIGAVPDQATADPAGLRATTFLGWAPSIAAALEHARIGIVAEAKGGGFKMKCLDYIFHHVPIAAVDGTAAGLGLQPGSEMLTAPDPARLCRMIADAVDDPVRLNTMATYAYRSARDRFDWHRSGRLLAELLAQPSATDRCAPCRSNTVLRRPDQLTS